MKNFVSLFVVVLTISSCCKDEVVGTHRLSDNQKSIISYDGSEELTFIDQNGDLHNALTTRDDATIDTYRRGTESCDLVETEELLSSLIFQTSDISLIELRLFADIFTSFNLFAKASTSESRKGFNLVCEDIEEVLIEENFQDVVIGQFEFQNVLVFQSCLENSQIQQIIFSKENGVEFIEFSDPDKWLKLN